MKRISRILLVIFVLAIVSTSIWMIKDFDSFKKRFFSESYYQDKLEHIINQTSSSIEDIEVDIADLIIAQKYESIIKYYDSLTIHYYTLASQKREERINEIYAANGMEYNKDSPFNDLVIFNSPARKKPWRLENATYEIDYLSRLKTAKEDRLAQTEELLSEVDNTFHRSLRDKYERFIENPYYSDSLDKEIDTHFFEDLTKSK